MCHNEILVRETREQVPSPPWECAGSKGNFGFIHMNSEGSGASTHLSLAWNFVTEPKPHVLAQMSLLMRAEKAMASLHICLV